MLDVDRAHEQLTLRRCTMPGTWTKFKLTVWDRVPMELKAHSLLFVIID